MSKNRTQLLLFATCAAVALQFTSCAPTSSQLERLRVGMSREEVNNAIGHPRSTTANGNSEILIYQFTDKPFGDGLIFPGTYYVRLDQGRVSGWNRDEVKDALDRERAYRLNAQALKPPQHVVVHHSGYVNQDVNLRANIDHNVNVYSR